jgi:hypothetical protein
VKLDLKACLAGLGLVASAAGAQDAVEIPNLHFTPTPAIEREYGQYFYYHRDDTDFATALADIRECDAYARGISLRLDGGASGPVVGAVTDAIFGAAQRRDIRRYGLPKAIWSQFNAEDGADEGTRERMMRIQARIASGPRPPSGAIDR